MSLKPEQVQQVAQLARLELPADRIARYTEQLSSILGLVSQLQNANTQGVEPMAHPLHMHQRLREDVVTAEDARARYQAIAPAVENGLYLVPKVIE